MKYAFALAILLITGQLAGAIILDFPITRADIPFLRAFTLVVYRGGTCFNPTSAPFCFNGTVPGPPLDQSLYSKTNLNITLVNNDAQNHSFTLPSPYRVYLLAKPNTSKTIRIFGLYAGTFTYTSNETGDASYLYGTMQVIQSTIYYPFPLDQFALIGIILTTAGVVFLLSRRHGPSIQDRHGPNLNREQ